MARPATESSLARRTLIAVGVALGGSALFVGGCLLLASTALDRALPSPQADVAADEAAELADAPTESGTSGRSRPRS